MSGGYAGNGPIELGSTCSQEQPSSICPFSIHPSTTTHDVRYALMDTPIAAKGAKHPLIVKSKGGQELPKPPVGRLPVNHEGDTV